MAPDGFLWTWRTGKDGKPEVVRVDPQTGEVGNAYPQPTSARAYQTAVSEDGRFVAGGSPPGVDGTTGWVLDVAKGKMYEIDTGDQMFVRIQTVGVRQGETEGAASAAT